MADQTELVTTLQGWCRGEGLDEAHALLVIVPEDTDISEVEDALQTVKCLGRVRVRGRTFNSKLSSLMVLCECRECLTAAHVPAEVKSSRGLERWPIVTMSETPSSATQFSQKLLNLLKTEGKTIEDLHTVFPQPNCPTSPTESILRAVADLLDKTRPQHEGGSYRRLRLFSGVLPTPAGEEQLEHWLEQARLMIEESNSSDKEKRRRLMESLKGPALEIVKTVRATAPDISAEECLDALESAFGTAESGDDLYFAFRLMQQEPGEKISDFLRRLEHSLVKVVQRGGLPASCADKARLEQLLRGAVNSDLMLLHLRLRERKMEPPSFLELLKEIRMEEEYENLKREIKELKSMVSAVVIKPAQTSADQVPVNGSHHCEKPHDSESMALQKQVTRLQHKFEKRTVEPGSLASVSKVEASKPASFPKEAPKNAEQHFCYRCGEDGHFVAKCRNRENQAKVIRKLIHALRSVNGNWLCKMARPRSFDPVP
uniref:CCHC-type domain-containing protein n=1 Tax=Pygocentrus nattereri TaxID=42514 RepID=A0A3B4BYA9_PYGNA